jgi:aminoglycoside 3-N-acetyltransferase
MLTYRDITNSLQNLGLTRSTPVLAHIHANAIGHVKGGLNTLMGALLSTVDNVMMPTFTYSTMIIPHSGPADNDVEYGSGEGSNLNANVFSFDLPGDMPDNTTSESLRQYPNTYRSPHPVFSFTGLGLDIALVSHPTEDPYAPIRVMRRMGGWVLLMGSKPKDNFSIHLAEYLTGRKQFLRWALTSEGIREIPHFPGCSDGFHKLNYYLQEELHAVQAGEDVWQAVKIDTLVNVASALMKDDPFALLCNEIRCPRCNLVRESIKAQYARQWQSER